MTLLRRSPRLSDQQQAEIVRLAIHQVPQVEIARRVGVHRQTVKRVLERTRAALTINQDVEQDRAEALAVYREIQRSAWDAIERGRSSAILLGEIRQAQQRIDNLLGLAPADPDDPGLQLREFKAIVVGLIRREAPQLAPKLAERLLEVAQQGEDRADSFDFDAFRKQFEDTMKGSQAT